VQVPYIIYRNAKDEIIGIWFYDPEECEEVGLLFSR
jgi:mRNA-decapping enzyme 1B